MKITAIIDDHIIENIKILIPKKTLTESLSEVLSEWIRLQKLKNLNEIIQKNPIEFQEGFSGESIRLINRNS